MISIRKEIIFIIAIIIAIIYLMITIKKRDTHKIEMKEVLRISIFLYFTALIGITLFPVAIPPGPEPYEIDFVNFDLTRIFNYGSLRTALVNVCGNILLFVPLIPLIQLNCPTKKITFLKAVFISLGLSVMIEGLQYLENILAISDFPIRITDISDVVLNSIGGMIGYLIIKLSNKYHSKS